MQILNRTNNIFELVTVEPVPDRLEAKSKEIMTLETETEDDKNLRLKGMHNDTTSTFSLPPFATIVTFSCVCFQFYF